MAVLGPVDHHRHIARLPGQAGAAAAGDHRRAVLAAHGDRLHAAPRPCEAPPRRSAPGGSSTRRCCRRPAARVEADLAVDPLPQGALESADVHRRPPGAADDRIWQGDAGHTEPPLVSLLGVCPWTAWWRQQLGAAGLSARSGPIPGLVVDVSPRRPRARSVKRRWGPAPGPQTPSVCRVTGRSLSPGCRPPRGSRRSGPPTPAKAEQQARESARRARDSRAAPAPGSISPSESSSIDDLHRQAGAQTRHNPVFSLSQAAGETAAISPPG